MNLLSATAARVVERDESSDEDSNVSDVERFKAHAGTLNLVHETLRRHATTITMGRQMWETPELTQDEKARAQETHFGGTSWPKTKDMTLAWPETEIATKAARETMKFDERRLQPFQGKTEPLAHLSREA